MKKPAKSGGGKGGKKTPVLKDLKPKKIASVKGGAMRGGLIPVDR